MGADPKKTKVDIEKLVKTHDNPAPKPTTGRLTTTLNEQARHLVGHENFTKHGEKEK